MYVTVMLSGHPNIRQVLKRRGYPTTGPDASPQCLTYNIRDQTGTHAMVVCPLPQALRRRGSGCESVRKSTHGLGEIHSCVDKPGHETMALTALPRYSSAMIAWTNTGEWHAITIAQHPVLHPAFRGAGRSRDMRGRFQRF